jgi:hypothetical protein
VTSGRRRSGLIVLAAALVTLTSCTGSDAKRSARPSHAPCAVTKASDRRGEPPAALREVLGADVHKVVGNGNLWVLASPEERGDRFPDGTYRFKIGCFRGIAAPLVLAAERLDGRGTAHVDANQSAYPPTGFLPSSVVASVPAVTASADRSATRRCVW